MNLKTRIGLFMLTPLTQGGGAEKYFINLATQLSDDRTQVDIITLDSNSFKIYARFIHIFTHFNFFGYLPLQGREKKENIIKQLKHARWLPTSFSNLKNRLKKYNIIYAKNEILDLLVLKLVCQKKYPPCIIGVHTPIIFNYPTTLLAKFHNIIYASRFYYWLLKDAASIHCSNFFTKSYVISHFNLPASLIYYPYKIEIARHVNSAIKFNKKVLNITFVGRLSEQKGVDLLLKLINDLPSDLYTKITINIFGSGDETYLKKIKQITSKNKNIRYFGHINNNQLLTMYKDQDLLISPSRWEVLPYNILEAQSQGIPVIAFNIPGPQDIINQNTGILVNTYQELLDSTIKFVNHYYNFDKNKITKNIQTKFEPSKIYRQLKKLLIKYSHDHKQA